MLGVDPRPFSLRELLWMFEARQIDKWNHTASILAMQVNTASGKKRKAYTPHDFHPFAKRKPSREETVRNLNAMVGIHGN